jgi:hypothetical protein
METTMTANTVRQLAEREYSNVYKVDRIDNAFPSMYLSQWSVTLLTAGPVAVIRDLGDGTAILCTDWNYVTGYTETLIKY